MSRKPILNGELQTDLDAKGFAIKNLNQEQSGIPNNFLSLIDTPDSYDRQDGKLVAVAAGGAGVEFVTNTAPVVVGEIIAQEDVASVSFPVIPQGYNHLRLVSAARNTGGSNQTLYALFNGDSTPANYIQQYLTIDDTTLASTQFSISGAWAGRVNSNAIFGNDLSISELNIYFYTALRYKRSRAVSSETIAGRQRDYIATTSWHNITPISSLTLTSGGGFLFREGAHFILYAST